MVFFPLEMERRIIQTKLYYKCFYSVWKKWLTNFQNKHLQRTLFVTFVCYRLNLLRWMFFILCDNWKTLFFINVCPMSWCFLWKDGFERIPYFTLSPQQKWSANTKVQTFSSYFIITFFALLNFVSVPQFYLYTNFFWKIQNLCESMCFYRIKFWQNILLGKFWIEHVVRKELSKKRIINYLGWTWITFLKIFENKGNTSLAYNFIYQ